MLPISSIARSGCGVWCRTPRSRRTYRSGATKDERCSPSASTNVIRPSSPQTTARLRARSSERSDGSTAVTRAPARAKLIVSVPMPHPISSTRLSAQRSNCAGSWDVRLHEILAGLDLVEILARPHLARRMANVARALIPELANSLDRVAEGGVTGRVPCFPGRGSVAILLEAGPKRPGNRWMHTARRRPIEQWVIAARFHARSCSHGPGRKARRYGPAVAAGLAHGPPGGRSPSTPWWAP